jgi:hypothetical protein
VGVFPLAWAVNVGGGLITVAILARNYVRSRKKEVMSVSPA